MYGLQMYKKTYGNDNIIAYPHSPKSASKQSCPFNFHIYLNFTTKK
jgi:hypothetical protein